MNAPKYLLIDISNTFTKIATATEHRIGRARRLPTSGLCADDIRKLLAGQRAVGAIVSSVVPGATRRIAPALPPQTILVGPRHAGGLVIDYPRPNNIGADRLANAIACRDLYGSPAIVVDFGTAVTFDVISAAGAYLGGVIAPGLNLMAEYLHSRTALLPLLRLRRPLRAVGRSTREAMLSGAVHGYRGLVSEILNRVSDEEFGGRRPMTLATGGDATLIGESLPLFDHIDDLLTLRGLQIILRKEIRGFSRPVRT